MSTRETIWYGESEGRTVHLYFELRAREFIKDARMAAPIYISVEGPDSRQVATEVAMRLPKEISRALLTVLSPDGLRYDVL